MTGRVCRVQRISNMALDALYDSHWAIIARETGPQGVNEKSVWHGTKPDTVIEIARTGFDDRFCNDGAFGRGAYFAEDSRKVMSHIH